MTDIIEVCIGVACRGVLLGFFGYLGVYLAAQVIV